MWKRIEDRTEVLHEGDVFTCKGSWCDLHASYANMWGGTQDGARIWQLKSGFTQDSLTIDLLARGHRDAYAIAFREELEK